VPAIAELLPPSVKTPVSGAVALSATARGEWAAPEIQLRASAEGLRYGDHAVASAQAQAMVDHYAGRPDAPSHWLIDDPAVAEAIWTIRETAASASALGLEGSRDPQVGWEDAAVDPMRLGDYLREFQALVDRYGYETSLYGHFGDGCIHARITFDLRTPEGIAAAWDQIIDRTGEIVPQSGGEQSAVVMAALAKIGGLG
jgi:FAD/FMN-containing dehydrogenase